MSQTGIVGGPETDESAIRSRMARVAIIGFAGGHCTAPLSPALYERMVARAEAIIRDEFGLDVGAVELVSGGAAWSDHVAVALFLRHTPPALTVYAPCEWDADSGRFVDNGRGRRWTENPGYYANVLHERFATTAGATPFADLRGAVALGATIRAGHGFHARNTSIADAATHMIAFSWSDGAAPDAGGTRDTWSKCGAAHKVHVPMTSLQ